MLLQRLAEDWFMAPPGHDRETLKELHPRLRAQGELACHGAMIGQAALAIFDPPSESEMHYS